MVSGRSNGGRDSLPSIFNSKKFYLYSTFYNTRLSQSRFTNGPSLRPPQRKPTKRKKPRPTKLQRGNPSASGQHWVNLREKNNKNSNTAPSFPYELNSFYARSDTSAWPPAIPCTPYPPHPHPLLPLLRIMPPLNLHCFPALPPHLISSVTSWCGYSQIYLTCPFLSGLSPQIHHQHLHRGCCLWTTLLRSTP